MVDYLFMKAKRDQSPGIRCPFCGAKPREKCEIEHRLAHSEAYHNRRLAWGKGSPQTDYSPPNEILILVLMPVTPVQYIHHLVVGYVARHVVTVHDIAHASLHARHLVAVICPPILLPA